MKNIVLIGIMGSGKTTLGKILSDKLHLRFVDADDYLVDKYQMSIHEMFDISEDYFRDRESECCKDFTAMQDTVIATGGGVIKRAENIEELKRNGKIFYIDRPISNIVNDVDTSGRPLLKEGAEKLYELDHERHALYLKSCDVHIINDGTLEETAQKIIDHIQES